MKKKLNVLLALTDQLRHGYKNMVSDYSKFFSKSQGAFRGEKKTYTPRDGVIDEPKKRGTILVTTTVKEKLDYFTENASKFIDALFSQEKTNASGNASAELVVDGESWGVFTSLELLRLKSLLESKDLGMISEMIGAIPVRSDSEIWEKSDNENYSDREVFQTELLKGVSKTTIKMPFILDDPNVNPDKLPANYQAPIVQRDEVMELGDYTMQSFSGEWSHRERALALKRRNTLLTSITEALKVANECEIVESDLTAVKIFGYLFYNK
jgi:hypothetical protein